jgi:metal-responsive CopG/Arc/MetJ family transcriptional regulator
MRETITISINKNMKKKLAQMTKQERLNRSDIVREALRQYFVTQEYRRLRQQMLPGALARGVYTDEDVFQKVS